MGHVFTLSFFFVYSIKSEQKVKEKVIPCLMKNRWILPPDAKVVDKLDKEAADELLKGTSIVVQNNLMYALM